MVFSADEDIPYEVMVNPTGYVEAGAHAYLAKQEKLAHDQLDPTAKDLAVGAGSQLITPAIQQQLPLCVHKVRCTTFVSGSVWSQCGHSMLFISAFIQFGQQTQLLKVSILIFCPFCHVRLQLLPDEV